MLHESRQTFSQQNVSTKLYGYISRKLYYFRVIYLLESYHRFYFSIAESYVYYEFIKLYLLYSNIEVYGYIY